jgi:uncharacterized protein (TIGR02588 family)
VSTPPHKPPPRQHARRSGPEWITFGVSAVVLFVVVATLVGLAFRESAAAEPVARLPGPVREVDGQFFVPVDIVNRGDEGAAEVQVLAELTIGGETTSGDQVIDFLGGGEVQQLTFAFDDDPASGEIIISVTGFAAP